MATLNTVAVTICLMVIVAFAAMLSVPISG